MSEHDPKSTSTSPGALALSCASPAVASAAPGRETTHHTTMGGETLNVVTPDFADVLYRDQRPMPLPEVPAGNISEGRRGDGTPEGGDPSGAVSKGGNQADVVPKTPEPIEQQEGNNKNYLPEHGRHPRTQKLSTHSQAEYTMACCYCFDGLLSLKYTCQSGCNTPD